MFNYICDPKQIYQNSFDMVLQLTEFGDMRKLDRDIAIRLIHACGMPSIIENLRFSLGAVESGHLALKNSARIFVDSEMVGAGIIKKKLIYRNTVTCTLNEPAVAAEAEERGMTRSAVAVELWDQQLEGAIVVFGNAPTALFRFLELLNNGGGKPALILAFPVGFVGALESKEALCKFSCGVPYITLLGRNGGSAIAAAAVNALTIGTL